MPEIELRGGALDGLRIHYVVDGRGPAVLLVHGLGGFAESWRHNIGYLGRHATVYAIDLPGFGSSGKPRATYGLAFFAQALRRFVEATGLGRVTLVGHSLGGAVAVAYAATHPESLERLALLGAEALGVGRDRKSTRLNSSHSQISYAVFCLKKKKDDNSVLLA